jgi:hypothetical protein
MSREDLIRSAEALRILRAVRDGRMIVNEVGRYEIRTGAKGEVKAPAPDRRVREALMHSDAITWAGQDRVVRPSGLFDMRLEDAEAADRERRDAEDPNPGPPVDLAKSYLVGEREQALIDAAREIPDEDIDTICLALNDASAYALAAALAALRPRNKKV